MQIWVLNSVNNHWWEFHSLLHSKDNIRGIQTNQFPVLRSLKSRRNWLKVGDPGTVVENQFPVPTMAHIGINQWRIQQFLRTHWHCVWCSSVRRSAVVSFNTLEPVEVDPTLCQLIGIIHRVTTLRAYATSNYLRCTLRISQSQSKVFLSHLLTSWSSTPKDHASTMLKNIDS